MMGSMFGDISAEAVRAAASHLQDILDLAFEHRVVQREY